jgi:predicted porin
VRKLLICALALGGFAASAQAADLSVDSLKDPLPEKLSFAGVTVYGTIDVGYGYQTAGLPASGLAYTSFNYGITKDAHARAVNNFQNNAMSQSFVGVKVEESIGAGFVALGKIESGFDPLTGDIADACKSLIVAKANTTNPAANFDGGRCGQLLNGQAYAGLSNASYGTLTIGRHNSFMTDGVGTYDPNHGSYAFSLIGYSGGAAGGIGSTETSRWDNSLKYVYQFGPAHAGVMYSGGGDNTSIRDNAIGANVGATYKGFSVDAYYTKENGAVNASANTFGAAAPLLATISNNEAYSIMGKYTFDLGGGFKDEGPSAKLTFFGGYVHMDITNPDHTQDYYNNGATIGDYVFATSNNNAFLTNKVLQTAWAGASYETGAWTFTGAYYAQNQNTYTTVAGVQSGGDLNWVSGVVDYKFNKHFDVYGGVSWDGVTGPWTSGYKAATETTNVVTGLRLKF